MCSDEASCAEWEFGGRDCAAYAKLEGYGVSPAVAGKGVGRRGMGRGR